MLPIISKTKNTQISSYYNLSGLSKSSDFVNLYKYYPDLNPQEILKKNPNNIILFVMVKNKKEVVNFKEKKIFENFFIFSELNYPLNETNSILLILLPKDIITKIN